MPRGDLISPAMKHSGDEQNTYVIWPVVDDVPADRQRPDAGSELRPLATKTGESREKGELFEECVDKAIRGGLAPSAATYAQASATSPIAKAESR